MGHGANINILVPPFHIHTDLVDPWGNYFRGGTLFTILNQTEVKASLSVRSLHNMFDTQDIIICSANYGLQPYEYMNIIQQISQGKTVDITQYPYSPFINTGAIPQPEYDLEPLPPTKNPNVRIREKQTEKAVAWAKERSAAAKKAHTKNTNPIKKVYCPYNYDLIVYDNNNCRINEFCGELTLSKYIGIMDCLQKNTTFEGFEYFKEACFELGIIPRIKEYENNDFEALEAMKGAVERTIKELIAIGHNEFKNLRK